MPQHPDRDAPLAGWLDYQLRNHPHAIELGLERVRDVYRRMGSPRPAQRVITVGGTNGKGSTVAFLEALALAHGLSVATYTSPHLLRYEERVRFNADEVAAADLVRAFADIEAARGDTTLTYFEWGTLAALQLMAERSPDLAVLEVGLGGRLDAVNIIDADVAVITSVDLDHQALLGADRETIGIEKAGIIRAGGWLVLSEAAPPASVLTRATQMGCQVLLRERDFAVAQVSEEVWRWASAKTALSLPMPALAAPCQTGNAAAAIAAYHCLFPLRTDQAAEAMRAVRLRGRLQCVGSHPEWILDVAHNPHAVGPLASWLAAHPVAGATHAVLATLADKDAQGMVAPLLGMVDAWHLAGLDHVGPRDHPVEALRAKAGQALAGSAVFEHRSVHEAMLAVRQTAAAHDRIVVFGSFHTVAEAMQALQEWGQLPV